MFCFSWKASTFAITPKPAPDSSPISRLCLRNQDDADFFLRFAPSPSHHPVCKPTDLVRSLVMDDKAKARGAAGISGLTVQKEGIKNFQRRLLDGGRAGSVAFLGFVIQRLAASKPFVNAVPVFDPLFTQFPAQIHFPAVPKRRKIHQASVEILHNAPRFLDVIHHFFKPRHGFLTLAFFADQFLIGRNRSTEHHDARRRRRQFLVQMIERPLLLAGLFERAPDDRKEFLSLLTIEIFLTHSFCNLEFQHTARGYRTALLILTRSLNP